MLKTFDLVLLYYDKPDILRNWFHRLNLHSDFGRFISLLTPHIIIADSGTPLDRVEATLEVIKEQPDHIRQRIIYARAETEAIRKAAPEGVLVRPQCHAYNMAVMNISKADVVIGSIIGHIFSPKYFNGHIAEHIKNERCVVLPRRFDLICSDYHINHYMKSWTELKQFPFQPSGGWPDFSVRREHYNAIGGWDEWYTFVSPADMDFGSRLCGKLDNGAPSQMLFTFKPDYVNLGLDFIQPYREDDILSLTCSTYSGHKAKSDPEREKGHQIGNVYYLDNWGKVVRNPNRVPLPYSMRQFS